MRAILPSDTFPWYPENLYDRLIISQIEGNSRIYRITKILSSPISYDLLDVFMIPSNITREHILQALQEINMRGVPSSREPTKFALVWNGKLYPPKYTISLANKYPNREELDPSAFSGGDETNPFLTKLDFPIINITKWKEITGILKQIYDTRSKNENLQNIINSKNEVLSKYQPVFSPEHIPYLKAEEFSDFLYFGNNKHWSGLHRQKETITQDMEGLKSALLILVDESLPVRDRLDRIRPKGGKSLVKGIGEAISTAILQVIGPDKYGVWNTTSKKGLEKAGIFPLIKKDASFGEQYVALNEVLIALSRAINVDLWTLDALLYEYATRDGEKSEQDKEDVLLPDENGSFLINAVNDTISIAETIVREGLDNKKISQTVDADVYNEKYNKIIKPLISNFNEKYGNTPNLLLKDIVSEFASKNHLSEDFEIHSFPFYGQKVNSYVWAAITKKTINYKDRKASHFPQLYVLINAYSIRFGVTYGNHVKSDDPMVNIFRSDRELQVIVKNLLRNNLTIQVYKEKSPNSLLPKDALLTNILLQDNFEEWTNETNILENHPKDKIPDNLKDRIITVFTLLFPLFELATYADDYQKIPELKAKYRFDKTNSLNTWNLVKEKIGYSLSNFDFSLKNLYFEADEETRIKRQILAALKSGKHIILIGPPGTGKSKLAQEICNKLVGPTNYQMATASSDWSTYETIGGYRPDREGKLYFYPGIFLRSFKDENGQPINKWLIIDEINRADIDKAFGALFSALTGDTITIPFEIENEFIKIVGKPDDTTPIKPNIYIIHPDWRIIATMNTFDKSSLYEMSYAFMRRFAFIPINIPSLIDEHTIQKYTQKWGLAPAPEISRNVSVIWQTVNKRRKIGPAIIHDIIRFITESDNEEYESSIIMYILPQFEGLIEDEKIGFIRDISNLDCIKKKDYLKNHASEFFGISRSRFD